jgi:hypothetical protein
MEQVMAPDDRDRTFEKALARHVRLSSRADAELRGAAPNESCPDPETLAAYHERSLSLQELNSWKQHIAGCGRCQLVLAHLETTEDVPLGVAVDENVVAVKAPVFAQSPVHASSAAMRAASPALSPPRSVLEKAAAPAGEARKFPRRTQWRWLAPAGALAAGLLVWVALHESQPARLTTQPPVQEAQNREPSPPPQPVLTAPATKPDKDQRARTPELSADLRADAKKILPQSRGQQLGRQTASASAPNVELDSPKKEAEEKATRVVTADAQAADKSKAQVDELSGQRETERQTAVQQPAFVSTEASASPAAPAPPARGKQSQTKVESKSAAVAGAVSSTADNKISSNLQSMKPFHLAKTPNSRVVSSPGDKLLWLLGSNGFISVSSDNGTTWTEQSSGVTAELLAGSAPTEQVCWIVGSSGTILRTTDGGAHWFKQNSPITSDWFSIRATDALHARIWSAPDPQSHSVTSYQTHDGGVTWTQVSNP